MTLLADDGMAAAGSRYRQVTARARPRRSGYRDNPAAWAHDCVTWPEGRGLTAYQDEILEAVVTHGRVAARGPHGLGKTTMMAMAIGWFATTRATELVDWKAVTTASAWRQLKEFLWPEVHKWYPKINWARLDLDPLTLLDMAIKARTGHAFAVASDNPALIEGAHADSLFYGFDEAKTIIPKTWDAAEGAFSGAGADTAAEAFALAVSTPGEPIGRFYEIHKRQPGTEDWWARHVTLEEAIAAGRISRQWADQRALQWGPDSALFKNRVLGEFASADEDGVIPLAWIEAAMDAFKAVYGSRGEWWEPPGPLTAVGADIARSGSDSTVFASRYGDTIGPLEYLPHNRNTMVPAGQLVGILRANPKATAVVDVIGVGAGVYDKVREERGDQAVAFTASAQSTRTDRSGKMGFLNLRAEAWWGLREALEDGANGTGPQLLIPPDDRLLGDLTSPKWTTNSRGLIQIEKKDDIRERIGRSTDAGDAVVQACWVPPEFGPPDDWAPAGTVKTNEWGDGYT